MCTNCHAMTCSCPDGTELTKCACSMNIDCASCGHSPRTGSEDAPDESRIKTG